MRRFRGSRRSRFSGLIAVICALLALSACTSAAKPAQRPERRDPRPNLVFILTDDLSSDLLAYMPHVQALARAGTSFSNYFVVDSLCCPSRSAILTGEYPHNNGVFTNHGLVDGGYHTFVRRGDENRTFAIAMQRAGYRTGFMGKYLNEYQPIDRKPPGWNDFESTGNGYPEYNYVLNDNGVLHRYGHAPGDYLTDVLSRRADKFVGDAAHQSKPFALEVATFAPHGPATPAPQDRDSFPTVNAPRGPAFDRPPKNPPSWDAHFKPLTTDQLTKIDNLYRKRVESVQAVDRMVGRLEAKLDAEGLLSNTYFVFSSDNGFHMGQYRLMPGKQTAFDTDIKVPLIVAGPGVSAGSHVGAIASSIDLAPTFTALAGGRPVGDPDGASLLPLWHGQQTPKDWQRAALVEHHGPDTFPQDPDLQTLRQGNPPSYQAVRTAHSLYVEYRTGEREYYDLSTDPDELDNLIATAPPARIAALRAALHHLTACRGAESCQAAAQVG